MSDEREQVQRQLTAVRRQTLARTRLVTRGGELANHLSASAEIRLSGDSVPVEVTLPDPNSDFFKIDLAGVAWRLPYSTWEEMEPRDTWIIEWTSHEPMQEVIAGEIIAIMWDVSVDSQVNIPAPVDGTLIQLLPDGIATSSVIGVVETLSPLPRQRPEPSLADRGFPLSAADLRGLEESLARKTAEGHR